MKKLLLLLLMISCLGMCTLPAYASSAETPPLPSENLDSFHLTGKEKNDFQIKISDTVVRLYNGYYMHSFAEEMPIAEIIKKRCIEYEYMILPAIGKARYMHYWQDGKPYQILELHNLSDWKEFYRYAANPHLVLNSTVKVSEVYCLTGAPSYDGVYIYYVTDHGDYILYREYLTAPAQYLFPIQEFYGVAKKIAESRVGEINGEFVDGCGGSIEEVCDATLYQVSFRSEESAAFPWGWVAAGAAGVLVIGGTAIALLCWKKKKASKASQE